MLIIGTILSAIGTLLITLGNCLQIKNWYIIKGYINRGEDFDLDLIKSNGNKIWYLFALGTIYFFTGLFIVFFFII